MVYQRIANSSIDYQIVITNSKIAIGCIRKYFGDQNDDYRFENMSRNLKYMVIKFFDLSCTSV